MRVKFICIVSLLIGAATPGRSEVEETRPITLVVNQLPSQRFEGFGCSLVDLSNAKIPDVAKAKMFDSVFGDLKMNVLRLWVESGVDRTCVDMKADFYRQYVDTEVIANAQERGVTTLLLAPARGEKIPSEPMSDYARKIAEFIEGVRLERKVIIDVTGIANEPSGFTANQFATAMKTLRQELDIRGLKGVRIIGPEWASADNQAYEFIAQIKKDKLAWSALSGIATHSYNMAATKAFPDLTSGTNKGYWITEAGDNGNEGEDNLNLAASTCARLLNDLNHGVTHWIYFIGFHASDDIRTDDDSATKLLVYDFKQQRVIQHLKFSWLEQLRAAFPTGTQIYPLRAEPGDDLVYSYGQKPLLNAAMGKRPTGGWSLGVVNLTGLTPNTEISKWHAGTHLKITLVFPSQAIVEGAKFEIHSSSANKQETVVGEAIVSHARLHLELHTGEIITLLQK